MKDLFCLIMTKADDCLRKIPKKPRLLLCTIIFISGLVFGIMAISIGFFSLLMFVSSRFGAIGTIVFITFGVIIVISVALWISMLRDGVLDDDE